MDTEVVIWSSKVQQSPPPASNHAPWTTHVLHDQPDLSWAAQREPKPLPVSNYEVNFSALTSFHRFHSHVCS